MRGHPKPQQWRWCWRACTCTIVSTSGIEKREHIHSAVNFGEISIGNHLRWLVADTNLEASRAPVNELDSTLGLQGGNGRVDIVGNDITTVQQASGHVFAVAGITLDHLVVGLEARVRDLLH